MADREAEPGTLPHRLRREKGIEDPRHHLRRDARAVVGDRDADDVAAAVGHDRDLVSLWIREGEGLPCVHEQVHEHLCEPRLVGADQRHIEVSDLDARAMTKLVHGHIQ